MSKKARNSPPRLPSLSGRDGLGQSGESRAAEALTVGWALTITTVFLCDLASLAAHFYARDAAPQSRVRLLGDMLLFSAVVVGMVSLVLLPIVLRVRRHPPPRSVVAWGACAAIAPLMAVAWRVLR